MKYVILHYFFIVHLCNMQMCDTLRRHKPKHGRYDINGFITQLLASRRFDELAEKLAEKAANKIMNLKADQGPIHVDRASDVHEVQKDTETTTLNTWNQSEEKHDRQRVELKRGFSGKIDAQAVMDESILLTEDLKLKYKDLKKNAIENKIKVLRELVNKNSTSVDLPKQNKTSELADNQHNNENNTGGLVPKLNKTQQTQKDVTIEPIHENEGIIDDIINDSPRVDAIANSEVIRFHSNKDSNEQKESSQKNDQSKEPSLDQEPINYNWETNSETEAKEQEPTHVDNGIKEEIASSLDEQNRQYLPSAEKTNTEMEKVDEQPLMRATKESSEFGNAVAYFRGRGNSVEGNKVTSEPDRPNPYGVIDRSIGSNDSGNDGSVEQTPEDQNWTEKADEEQEKPVIRREGDKEFTYVRDPDYKDYHEEMAKWQKEHPENPADFL